MYSGYEKALVMSELYQCQGLMVGQEGGLMNTQSNAFDHCDSQERRETIDNRLAQDKSGRVLD
jgi:hypothetical protein